MGRTRDDGVWTPRGRPRLLRAPPTRPGHRGRGLLERRDRWTRSRLHRRRGRTGRTRPARPGAPISASMPSPRRWPSSAERIDCAREPGLWRVTSGHSRSRTPRSTSYSVSSCSRTCRNRTDGLAALGELARIARPGGEQLIGLTVHSTREEETFYVVKKLRREGIPEKPTHHWRRADFLEALRRSRLPDHEHRRVRSERRRFRRAVRSHREGRPRAPSSPW